MRLRRRRGAQGRNTIFLAVILIATLAFMFKLVDVQMVRAGTLNAESFEKRAVPITLPSVRGNIVDRDGVVLATTDERFDVNLSPKNTKLNGGVFTRPDTKRGVGTVTVTSMQAFNEIGEITGQSGDDIKKIVDDALKENKKSDFAYVKRGVDLTQLQQLKALYIPWLTFDTHHTRIYPNGAVGGNVVGFAGQDEVPQAGVELSQDECLVGSDGEETYEKGADGVALPGSIVQTKAAVNGGTVTLTLDRDLQWQAQQVINQKVREVAAEYGYLVIMDVRTGELLAVAEDDSVDPNDVDAVDSTRWNARSFTYPYEPGSTFKAITAAALIEEGKATPNSTVTVPYAWQPEDGVSFSDALQHDEKHWTLTGTLVYSSNVGISMLGSSLSPETRYEYLHRFGIGESTKAGMPLEDAGLVHDVSNWDAQTNYVTMFGQGLSSTIVQTAGVYQTIANGGVRIPPTLVKSCTAADGTVTEPDHGDPVRVVSEDTAKQVKDMLETSVNEGFFERFITVPGYRISGKTGTAEQTNDAGQYRSDYVHSFAGMFPAEDPQYVIVASIGFPAAGADAGGVAATTAFRDATEATIRHFHIPPSTGAYQKLEIGDVL